MNSSITVRALRPNEWDKFRAIRLKALKEHPSVFLSSYDREAGEPEPYWSGTLDGKGKQVFGLFDGERLCGIAAVFTWRGDASGESGVMAMDYVDGAYRGQGLSRLLYRARIDWALTQKQFRRLVISHREGNEASRRAMLAAGFVYKGKEVISWPDGAQAEEWNYTLDLENLRVVA